MNRKVHSISAKHNVSIAISVMVVLAMIASIAYAYATFFYTASTTNGEFLSEIGSRPIFISDAGDDISLDIKILPDLAPVNETSYPLDSKESEVLISLQNDYNKKSACKYNLYWQWDETEEGYTLTEGEEKEFTVSGQINGQTAFKEVQLNNYSVANNKMLLYTGYINNSGGVISNQTINITTIFYKTKSAQDHHKGKAYSGKLVVDDVDCSTQFFDLSNHVISLAGKTYETTQETINDATWTVDNILNSGYRYRGENPDNYVLYNNELWRIIGVFESQQIGHNYVPGDEGYGQYVKIVKDTSIGQMSFNEVENYLSTTYYNSLNDTAKELIFETDEGYAYTFFSPITYEEYTPASIYEAERAVLETGEEGYRAPRQVPIDLIYPSDYGFASYSDSDSSCSDISNTIFPDLSEENLSCNEYNWLILKDSNGNPISQFTNALTTEEIDDWTSVAIISGGGSLYLADDHSSVDDIGNVRPSLYLYNTVEVIGGIGTKDSPYILNLGNFSSETKIYYYAFGQYYGSYPTTTTDYTTLGKNVFVRDDTPDETTRELCIVRTTGNPGLHCFKNNNLEIERTHVQEVFSDITCDVDSSYVYCNASDFDCFVYSNGGVTCDDNSTSEACIVYSDGDLYCGQK